MPQRSRALAPTIVSMATAPAKSVKVILQGRKLEVREAGHPARKQHIRNPTAHACCSPCSVMIACAVCPTMHPSPPVRTAGHRTYQEVRRGEGGSRLHALHPGHKESRRDAVSTRRRYRDARQEVSVFKTLSLHCHTGRISAVSSLCDCVKGRWL